jgi:hypothetical protein
MVQYSITAAAANRMLCTRDDVKDALGIGADPSDDLRVDRLITAASEQIRQLLGRDPWLQSYTEKRPGNGGASLRLKHWPLKGGPDSVTYGTGSSPTTVDATTYSVSGDGRRDRLYRASLWSITEVLPRAPVYGSQKPEYTITYSAGWVVPDEITAWSAGATVVANEWYCAKGADAGDPFIFQADATGGTTGSSEPTWPTVAEGTVDDNGITWTAYDQRLPLTIEEAAIVLATETYEGAAPSGVKRESFEGRTIEYFSQRPALAATITAMLGAYQ